MMKLALVFLSLSMLFTTHALFGQTSNRELYAVQALPSLFAILPTLAKSEDFRKSLSAGELDQLDGIYALIEQKILMAMSGFQGGSKSDLWRRIGLSIQFSEKPEDFILNLGEPERSAKTTETWTDPIVFNNRILNDVNSDVNFLDVLQISLHELGHKLGARKKQTDVDSLSAKCRMYLERFYVKSNLTSYGHMEMLSLPYTKVDIAEGFHNAIIPFEISTNLLFWINPKGKVSSVAVELRRAFDGAERVTSNGYNLTGQTVSRVADINTQVLPDGILNINFAIETTSRVVFQWPQQNILGVIGSTVVTESSFSDIVPPKTVFYNYTVEKRTDEFGDQDHYEFFKGSKSLRPQSLGIAKGAQISLAEQKEDLYRFKVTLPIEIGLKSPFLVLSANRVDIHLKPKDIKQTTTELILHYEFKLPKEAQVVEYKIGHLADSTFKSMSFEQPLKVLVNQTGKKSERPSLQGVFYNAGNGFKQLMQTGITPIASLEPGIAVALKHKGEFLEARITWKKGSTVSINDTTAGVVSEFATEIFSYGEFVQEADGNSNFVIMKSRLYSQPAQEIAQLKGVALSDNGWRDIKEITLIPKDLSTPVRITDDFDAFFTDEHIEAPIEMIEEVRRKSKIMSCNKIF